MSFIFDNFSFYTCKGQMQGPPQKLERTSREKGQESLLCFQQGHFHQMCSTPQSVELLQISDVCRFLLSSFGSSKIPFRLKREHTGSARGHATKFGSAWKGQVFHSWECEEIKLFLHPNRIVVYPPYECVYSFGFIVVVVIKVKIFLVEGILSTHRY